LAGNKADNRGLPIATAGYTKFDLKPLNIKEAHGLAFGSNDEKMFILDAGTAQIVSLVPHTTLGFDANEAIRSKKVQRISLKKLGANKLNGLAYNPGNGHLYVTDPSERKLFELTQDGKVVATFDLASLGINNPMTITFAPSVDNTDDPNKYDLFVLDGGQTTRSTRTGILARAVSPQQNTSSGGQIVEISLVAPASLPPGTTLLPTSLVKIIDTSIVAWSPSAPDPAGVDYWPLTNRLFIVDSEVDEMPNYYMGKNVYLSTTSGTLMNTCVTSFTNEPTGVAINPNNNHIFISSDGSNSRVFEVSLGPDGIYCTADDTVTATNVTSVYGASDVEDVAYGNNTLFIADGINAEVYRIPLGANGVLGGGDDGAMTHFDTNALGFKDLEGIGYNADSGTLFIVSAAGTDRYLGETTTTGALLRAYDLALMGSGGNKRSDVTYAPGSQNPATKSIYIASRNVDNNNNPNENDGQVWEINIGSSATSTPSQTPTRTSTPTAGPSPTATSTLTHTATPSITPTIPASGGSFYGSFGAGGSVGNVSFADEDLLQFNGTSWGLFFDGSDVGLSSVDIFAFHLLDADSLLFAFNVSITLGGVTYSPTDLVRFDATSLGSVTAGTFSMYFNGVDVGLDTSADEIDALDILPNGNILVSTKGIPTVPGLSGLADEDILAFTPSSLGSATSGTWSLYFDGSDVGLADSNNEDLNALDVDSNGNIYLSTLGDFSVTGVSGADEDVFVCMPVSLGSATACNFASALYFDGSVWGLDSNEVNAFNLLESGTIPTATPINTSVPTSTPTKTPTPTNNPGPTSTPTNTPTFGFSPTPTNTISNTPTFTPTPTSVSGGSYTIVTDADAYVVEANPTSKQGTKVILWVQGGTDPDMEGNLRFSVSGISGTIQSAVLRVYATSATVDGPAVFATSNDWTETGITWNTRPTRISGPIDDKGAISGNTWVEYNVTAFISGNGTYSFVLVTDNADSVSFSSREGGQPPQLVLMTGP
jgi:hypothetical protein